MKSWYLKLTIFVTSSLFLMSFVAGIALILIDLFVEPDSVEADSLELSVVEEEAIITNQLANLQSQTAVVNTVNVSALTRNTLDGLTFGNVRPFDKPNHLVGYLASKNELSQFSPAYILTAVADEVSEAIDAEVAVVEFATTQPTVALVKATATAETAPLWAEASPTAPTMTATAAPTNITTKTPTAAPTPTPTTIPTNGTYTVQRGDSVNSIAINLGVSLAILLKANDLKSYSVIYPGDVLVIPDIKHLDLANLGPIVWPVESRYIIKQYQYGHQAIDIVLPSGSPVVALAAGKVEYAGWNPYGYGYMVQIDHGNNVHTLYAHLSAFYVQSGDEVTQGQLLADSGNTGNSTMPHLHLEIRDGYQLVNPCLYLPDGC